MFIKDEQAGNMNADLPQLTFRLEKRGDTWVHIDEVGLAPASRYEIELWTALERLQAEGENYDCNVAILQGQLERVTPTAEDQRIARLIVGPGQEMDTETEAEEIDRLLRRYVLGERND